MGRCSRRNQPDNSWGGTVLGDFLYVKAWSQFNWPPTFRVREIVTVLVALPILPVVEPCIETSNLLVEAACATSTRGACGTAKSGSAARREINVSKRG
jgi:hypothetical protein